MKTKLYSLPLYVESVELVLVSLSDKLFFAVSTLWPEYEWCFFLFESAKNALCTSERVSDFVKCGTRLNEMISKNECMIKHRWFFFVPQPHRVCHILFPHDFTMNVARGKKTRRNNKKNSTNTTSKQTKLETL